MSLRHPGSHSALDPQPHPQCVHRYVIGPCIITRLTSTCIKLTRTNDNHSSHTHLHFQFTIQRLNILPNTNSPIHITHHTSAKMSDNSHAERFEEGKENSHLAKDSSTCPNTSPNQSLLLPSSLSLLSSSHPTNPPHQRTSAPSRTSSPAPKKLSKSPTPPRASKRLRSPRMPRCQPRHMGMSRVAARRSISSFARRRRRSWRGRERNR